MRTQFKRLTRQRNLLLWIVFILVCLEIWTILFMVGRKEKKELQCFMIEEPYIELCLEDWTKPIETRYYETPWLGEYYEMQAIIWNVPIVYEYVETEYIGRYFITAYCPEECGYNGNNYPTGWKTSTDTICHYSEDWREPTTCAIDPRVRKYGEYIMVGDPDSSRKKIYRCEDCGPGVKGQWVDCFVETYSEVRSWDTRYDNVYLVSFKTEVLEGDLYRVQKIRSDIIREALMPTEIEYYKFGEK